MTEWLENDINEDNFTQNEIDKNDFMQNDTDNKINQSATLEKLQTWSFSTSLLAAGLILIES